MERQAVKTSQKFCLDPKDVLKRNSDNSYCALVSIHEHRDGGKYFHCKDDFGTFIVSNKIMNKFFENNNGEFILYENK